MSKQAPDFLKDATNVYRTPQFIVKQRLGVLYSNTDYNVLYSRDTFYRRTAQRDAEYEIAFAGRKDMEGRRLKTNTYVRTYQK